MMANAVIVGTQWGDEGKGKIVDLITERFDVVVRAQGGHNAGHTVKIADHQYILHLIPSGILHPDKLCVVGNGVVIDPFALLEELETLDGFRLEDRLFISNRCHLIMPYHNALENAEEARLGERRIGTTSRGIGPCYGDKIERRGIRLEELRHPELFKARVEENVAFKNRMLTEVYKASPLDPVEICDSYLAVAEKILPFVTDTAEYLNRQIEIGNTLLFEGAQGTLLDVDHGTFPFVTSSNATAGGVCTGTGVGPSQINAVIGISKAYTTRVGGGPFPTELSEALGEGIRAKGAEYGASTGRPRRCGWFDAVVGRYSCMINTVDTLAITKLDVLDELEEIKVCTGYKVGGEELKSFPSIIQVLDEVEPVYETHPGWLSDTSEIRDYDDFPENAKSYLRRISELVETDISIISVGPDRDATVIQQTNPQLREIFSD
jgi:adenylosuccinate synthase